MNVHFPTLPHLVVSHPWGEYNPAVWLGNGRHMGTDIAGKVGDPIYAACDGMVDEIDLVGLHGYGRNVVIEHGGFKTRYAHLHKVFVTRGASVQAGEEIGEMGGDPRDNDPIDGASSGAHLHFEMIYPTPPDFDFVGTFAGFTVDPLKRLAELYGPAPVLMGITDEPNVRVRISPGTGDDNAILYKLEKNIQIALVDKRSVKGDTWVRLQALREEWACAVYQRRNFIRLESLPPSVEETPPPPVVDEKAARRDEVNRLIAFLEGRKKELE